MDEIEPREWILGIVIALGIIVLGLVGYRFIGNNKTINDASIQPTTEEPVSAPLTTYTPVVTPEPTAVPTPTSAPKLKTLTLPTPKSLPAASTTQNISCEDVTSYDYNWDNDMLCTRPDGSTFYTDYDGAEAYQ